MTVENSSYRRPNMTGSHIPIHSRRAASSSSSILSVSHLSQPKRVMQSEWLDEEDGNQIYEESELDINRQTIKPSRGPTMPRAPLHAMTNRFSQKGRVTSGQISQPSMPIVKSRETPVASVRRRISGGNAKPIQSRSTSGHNQGSSVKRIVGDGRMDAIETQLASMQSLFDLERKRTEDILIREQTERRQQEDKVRQLEEDLMEQRRAALLSAERNSRSLADDELDELLRKHQKEKRELEDEVDRERMTVNSLKSALEQRSTAHLTMDSTNAALRAQIDTLKGTIEEMEEDKNEVLSQMSMMQEENERLQSSLRDAESLRRKLHNEVQELRGNIRVFVRVRPPISAGKGVSSLAVPEASIRYTDDLESKRIELATNAESAMGTATMRSHAFEFDRVFRPEASQADVFAEVEHLIQSVLDGYNTCIFAYGQTGSGKTFTLEGPNLPNADALTEANFANDEGLIPRAVSMLWKTANDLQSKGWQYSFEGQMLEIYNEGINDLLGKAEVDKAKHEIRHEKGRTFVSDTVTVQLHSPKELFSLLSRAKRRRQVAATLMNERSSRSHCVFTLRVVGRNLETLESSDAVLNLVDLAGSERLNNSGSGKDAARLKEAQNINKSLSSLADVITALGGQAKSSNGTTPSTAVSNAAAHIPYRNSTLTWLLKNSLGGNSKTLMLLALSPLLEHQSESLCSLRFASKVNSTVIGTARRVRAA